MSQVLVQDVRKAYGAMEVIHGVDIDIADGEFVVLVGPSGCGKSTLLRMIAGLESITGGKIAIGDRVVNNVPPSERDIAMVFQSYALYPHMKVRENMAFSLRLKKTDPAVIEERVKSAAGILGLTPYLDRYPRQLSGGQRQRVAMGRAIVRQPKAFLFDEPLSNLDAKLRAHMRTELIELHRRLGKTMVYVTHDQLEAMTMSTRIAVMHGGNLQQFGTPSEIYNRPVNTFVASFIGTPSMTLVDADLLLEDGLKLKLGSTIFDIPETLLAAPPPGALPITLGIRPENIVLGGGEGMATIRLVEPTGHESIVTLDIDGKPAIVRAPGDTKLQTGESVRFDLRRDRLHFFDRDSGLRLNSDRTA